MKKNHNLFGYLVMVTKAMLAMFKMFEFIAAYCFVKTTLVITISAQNK